MSDDENESERRIRERAYYLWQEAGCPEGRDEEFWQRAREWESGRQTGGPADSGSALEHTVGDMEEAAPPPTHTGVI